MQTRSLVLAPLLVALASCAGAPVVPGSGYTADLSEKGVKSATLLVAKPIPRKLVVVLDPARVADGFSVTNTPHAVKGFQPFFKRSLQHALSPYFQEIVFVETAGALPAEPHVLADVKVDGLEGHDEVAGYLTYTILHMQWSFAIRPSESDDYLFSFAGVAQSESSYPTLDEGCQQTMKSAMHGLLESWSEKDVHAKLRSAVEPVAAPRPASQEI